MGSFKNEYFNQEDVIETHKPNKLLSLFHLSVLVILFLYSTAVMFSDQEGAVSAGFTLHLILTLPWAFFACRDLFFRKKMWMKVTTKGIAISRVFGGIQFIPWNVIKDFEERSHYLLFLPFIKIDPRVYLNFVEGYKEDDLETSTLQLSFFAGTISTTQKFNGYLNKYKTNK